MFFEKFQPKKNSISISSGFQLQLPRLTTRQPTQTPRRSHANLQIPRSAPPDSYLGGADVADVGVSQLNPAFPWGNNDRNTVENVKNQM